MKKGWGWSGVLTLLLVVAAVIPEAESGAFYEKTRIILKNNTKYRLKFKCWRNQEYLWMGHVKTIEPGKTVTIAFSFINIVYYVHGNYWCDYWRPGMKRMCRFKAYDYQKDYYHCRGPRGMGCVWDFNRDAMYFTILELQQPGIHQAGTRLGYCKNWRTRRH